MREDWIQNFDGLTEEAEKMLKFEPNLNDTFVANYR